MLKSKSLVFWVGYCKTKFLLIYCSTGLSSNSNGSKYLMDRFNSEKFIVDYSASLQIMESIVTVSQFVPYTSDIKCFAETQA